MSVRRSKPLLGPKTVVLLAALSLAAAWPVGVRSHDAIFIEAKLGLNSMSKTEQANLWKRVDEYATVDALQEFCGKKLNIQHRASKAVGACVEDRALRKVAAIFRSKKANYLKNWETAHGEPDKKKAVCEMWQNKLVEYKRIIDGQIAEAAGMCSACIFC